MYSVCSTPLIGTTLQERNNYIIEANTADAGYKNMFLLPV